MGKVKVVIDPKFAASVKKDTQAIAKAAKVQPRTEFDGPDGRYIGKLTSVGAKPDKNGKMGVNLNWTLTQHNEDFVGSPINSYFGLSEQKDKKGVVWQTKEAAYAELFGAMKHCGVPEKLLTADTLGKALAKLAELEPVAKLSVKTSKSGFRNVFVNGKYEDGGEEETPTDDEAGDDESTDDETTDDDTGDDDSSDESSDDDSSSDDDASDDSGDDSDDDSSDDDSGDDATDDEPVIPTTGDKYMYVVKGKNKNKPTVHKVSSVNRARSFVTLEGAYGIQKQVPFDKLGDLVSDDD